MKHQSLDRASARELTIEEAMLVAGGEDVETIYVTATKEQQAAAQWAYERASAEVNMIYYTGLAAGTAAAFYSRNVFFVVGTVVVTQAASDARDSLIEAMADYYYVMDSLDGVWGNYVGDNIYVTP